MRSELLEQTVVIIGGSAGIGLETARQARAAGAEIILTARNAGPLSVAANELGAQRTAVFDADDSAALQSFFSGLPNEIDHVMVTAGSPHYGRLMKMSPEEARRGLTADLLRSIDVARYCVARIRAAGSLIFMSGTGARRPQLGLGMSSIVTAAFPALIANLALELAPIRVNSIAPGFVDTRLSASILGGGLERRRDELRECLPIRRVVGPADVAALAIQLMSNSAITGAVYDIDGGQQFL
jgi:NAD(P)-dependent dehydrogenase (short-subunit alcohol dehydrogenase family)